MGLLIFNNPRLIDLDLDLVLSCAPCQCGSESGGQVPVRARGRQRPSTAHRGAEGWPTCHLTADLAGRREAPGAEVQPLSPVRSSVLLGFFLLKGVFFCHSRLRACCRGLRRFVRKSVVNGTI